MVNENENRAKVIYETDKKRTVIFESNICKIDSIISNIRNESEFISKYGCKPKNGRIYIEYQGRKLRPIYIDTIKKVIILLNNKVFMKKLGKFYPDIDIDLDQKYLELGLSSAMCRGLYSFYLFHQEEIMSLEKLDELLFQQNEIMPLEELDNYPQKTKSINQQFS